MPSTPQIELINRKFHEVFGASVRPDYASWLQVGTGIVPGAVLGYRQAGEAQLFLETYLDRPVEELASKALGRRIERRAIVEIGNFAADNALAMVELWGSAANDLGSESEVAVATLTAPLRRMFARIGVLVTVIAPASPVRLGDAAMQWGDYYRLNPMVCAGIIADGKAAIAAFLARRHRERQAA